MHTSGFILGLLIFLFSLPAAAQESAAKLSGFADCNRHQRRPAGRRSRRRPGMAADGHWLSE